MMTVLELKRKIQDLPDDMRVNCSEFNESPNHLTPDLTWFRVGYEFELLTNRGWEVGVFPELLSKNNGLDEYAPDSFMQLAHARVRVPYLKKEQIEAEGWTEGHYHGMPPYYSDTQCVFHKHSTETGVEWARGECIYGCIYTPTQHRIQLTIQFEHTVYGAQVIYSGLCNSINDFREICRLMGMAK